jgi:hypothetical protein
MLGFGALAETALAEIPLIGGAPVALLSDPRFISLPCPREEIASPKPRRRVIAVGSRKLVTAPRPRRRITAPPPRIRITAPKVKGQPVPQCPDFSPLDPNEVVTNTFDLAPWLPTGVTISSISSVSCAVYQGVDAGAASRIVGSPSVVASPSTSAAASAVLFKVGNNPIAGVTYRLQATIVTSDGQTLNPWAHQACQAPN